MQICLSQLFLCPCSDFMGMIYDPEQNTTKFGAFNSTQFYNELLSRLISVIILV